jgi:tetratricopeptide (TPR) repeat protein
MLIVVLSVSCQRLTDGLYLFEGNQAFREGRLHDAMAAYHRVVSGPLGVRAIFNLANAFTLLAEYEAAEALFRQAGDDPDSNLAAGAWYNLGVSAYSQGLYREAARHFRRALELQPADREVSRAYELAMNASHSSRMVADTERVGFEASRAGGTPALFGLSLPAPRQLFLPGGGAGPAGVDH